MFDEIGKALLSQGIMGAIALALAWAYMQKERTLQAVQAQAAARLDAEQGSRIEDAKAYQAALLGMQTQVIRAVDKLADVVTLFERRELERELREDAIAAAARRAP